MFTKLTVAFFVAVLSIPAHAEEGCPGFGDGDKFYIGAGAGSFRLKKLGTKPETRILSLPGVVGVIDVKKDGDVNKFFFGCKPWETVSLELTYLKATDFHVRLLASNSLLNLRLSSEKEGRIEAVGLSVKKDWPVWRKFSVYGIFGVYRYQLYAKMYANDGFQTAVEEDKEYGNTISATAGVAYRLNKKLTIAVEAERNGAKVNYITLTGNF